MNNFNTQDYDFLLKTLSQGSLIFKSEALKRLLMLAINDKKQFAPNVRQILLDIEPLYYEDKEDLNISATLLLCEILAHLCTKQHQHILINSHLQPLIVNLGHPTKPGIRKASHTCLLGFLRLYKNFNNLVNAYSNFGISNASPLVKQKAINSFQSILILELKCFQWNSTQSKALMENLLVKSLDENTYVAKAASQCLVSMCKIIQVKILISTMGVGYLNKLKFFLEQNVPNMNVTALKITVQDVDELIQALKKVRGKIPEKIKLVEEKEASVSDLGDKHLDQSKDLENYSKSISNNNNTQRRLDKIRNSIKSTTKDKKSSMLDKESTQSKIFGNLVLEGSIKDKTEAAEQLLYRIQANKGKPQFEASVKQILPGLIKMLRDTNPKLVGITLRILEAVIEDLNPNDKSFNSLLSVIVQKLGDQKISIRQTVSKVIRQLIRKTKKGIWIQELTENMKKNMNTFLRDETLSLILSIFQETPIDQIDYPIQRLLDNIVVYSDDPKTKIKIRTLDCLAQIVFVSGDVQKHHETLKPRMPLIFYQMYVDKVNKLLKQNERTKVVQIPKVAPKIVDEFSTTSRTAYEKPNRNYTHRRNDSEEDQKDSAKMNVSMEIVKRRVSSLRKPNRGLMSTQDTSKTIEPKNLSEKSLDGNNAMRTIEDGLEVVLPSLYKKTTTNKFITKKVSQFSPNKTSEHKNSGDYLNKQDLTPLNNEPDKQFKEIVNSLKSSDWKVLFQTTNRLRRLVQFNKEVILNAGKAAIHGLLIEVLSMVESLRSSVSKNALLALNDIMLILRRQIDSEIDLIFDKVIKKASDTNVFISAQVQRVMNTLSAEATPHKILDKVTAFRETKNIPIKDTCVNCLLHMNEQKIIRDKQYIKIVEGFAFFLFDGNQQVRNKAKLGVVNLCSSLGDWYRALRGKINPSYFKSICQIMTKAPIKQQRNSSLHTERYSTIKNTSSRQTSAEKDQYSTIKVQKVTLNQQATSLVNSTLEKSQRVGTSSISPAKKSRIMKVINFPPEFEKIQSYLQLSNSSDWKKRMDSLSQIKNLAIQFQNEFVQYRSSNHFVDTMCKQILQPNQKVSLNAMITLEELMPSLQILVENNLSLICNSVFHTLSSNRVELREKAESITHMILEEIDPAVTLQHLCHGVMYALPKSRVFLLIKLKDQIVPITQKKKQLLFKFVFPLMNKLMDEYKTEMMQYVVGVFTKLHDLMGNQMYSHLTKFKEVKELIGH